MNKAQTQKEELAIMRALSRKPTLEMKEAQNELLRKFLSKFQPKRPINPQKFNEEEEKRRV